MTYLTEQDFKNDFLIDDTSAPDISKYKGKRQYTLTDADDVVRYRIYRLDDKIWLARIHQDNANTEKSEYIWHIYKIVSFDGEIPTKVSIQ